MDILNDWQNEITLKNLSSVEKVLIGVLADTLPLNCLIYAGRYWKKRNAREKDIHVVLHLVPYLLQAPIPERKLDFSELSAHPTTN